MLLSRKVISDPPTTPWTIACQGSSVHGILQARKLEWIAVSFFGALPDPRIETASLLAGGFFTAEPTGKQL